MGEKNVGVTMSKSNGLEVPLFFLPFSSFPPTFPFSLSRFSATPFPLSQVRGGNFPAPIYHNQNYLTPPKNGNSLCSEFNRFPSPRMTQFQLGKLSHPSNLRQKSVFIRVWSDTFLDLTIYQLTILLNIKNYVYLDILRVICIFLQKF